MGKRVQKLILCIVIIDQSNGFRRNFMIQWKKKTETKSFLHWPWAVIFIKYH